MKTALDDQTVPFESDDDTWIVTRPPGFEPETWIDSGVSNSDCCGKTATERRPPPPAVPPEEQPAAAATAAASTLQKNNDLCISLPRLPITRRRTLPYCLICVGPARLGTAPKADRTDRSREPRSPIPGRVAVVGIRLAGTPYGTICSVVTRVLEETTQRRIYARKLRSFQFLVVQVFTVVVAIGPTSEFWAGKPEQIRIAAGLVAACGYLFSWRVARLAIVVEGDQLVIRNLFRTYRLERSSISAIEQPSRRAQRLLYTLKAGIRVVRADGRVVSATAYVVTPVDGPVGAGDFAKREVGELNEWLATGEPSAPPPDRVQRRAAHMADSQERRVNIAFFAWRVWLVILALLSVFGASLILSVMIDPLAN